MTLIAACLIVIGIGIMLIGVKQIVGTRDLVRTTGEITGTSDTGGFLDPYKNASFRFTTKAGVEQSVWSPDGASRGPQVGTKVPIAYDAATPSNAQVESPIRRFRFLFIGDVIFLAGVVLLIL